MRNFEERKAAIYRKSAEKIKKKKRYCRWIITASIALCLCGGILSTFPLWNPTSQGENEGNSYVNPLEDNVVSSQSQTTVTVTSDGGEVILRGQPANKSYQKIKALFSPQGGNFSSGASADSKGDESSSQPKKDTTYTIIFVTTDGQQHHYKLQDHSLTDLSAMQSITLSDSQLKDLKERFNIKNS